MRHNSVFSMKLTVVTINLNNGPGLKRTIESVRQQTFRDFEHIVIDAGSDDGSVEIIKDYADGLSYWISEPDSGIYNAMNKGVLHAKGEYLHFLNSGDTVAAADTYAALFDELTPDVDILFGDLFRPGASGDFELRGAAQSLTLYEIYRFRIGHPATLYKRDLFEKFGLYDESYAISGDMEFTVRCIIGGVTCFYTGLAIARYEGGGISETQKEISTAERNTMWAKYLPPTVISSFASLSRLERENQRLQKAELWIESAKRKPLWYNLALVCKWRWDRLWGRLEPERLLSTKDNTVFAPAGVARVKSVGAPGRPIIHLYAVCKNEARIIPYFLFHYDDFVDKFVIFDNGSTDGSLELLASNPKVKIVPFDTENKFDSMCVDKIKSSEWKASRGIADFVIVCDMDEFLHHPNMHALIDLLRARSFTMVHAYGYQMASEVLPAFTSQAITSIIKRGVADERHYSKTIMFVPDRIEEINYDSGCHTCNPTGEVKIFRSPDAKLLHYKFVDRDEVMRKLRAYRASLSESSRRDSLCRHYLQSDEQVLSAFNDLLAKSYQVIS